MAMGLENYKLKSDFEKLKEHIIKFVPDNEGLVNAVRGLTPKNNLLINSLIALWNKREVPELSEKDIIQQNLAYQSRPERQIGLAAVGLDPDDLVNEKRWVLKNREGWYGWIPETHEYTARPLIYEGDLDYEKVFERKVLRYQVSGSINLYRTMKLFLETFISMGLTDDQICEILLELCKRHVQHQYSSLSRHTKEAGKLWIELASSLNNDVEEGKVRKALCGISRKVGEPINLPLFNIKSLYDQILDLTHPGLDPKVHEGKATQHACKCIEFLVSKNIKHMFDNYQREKVINDEAVNMVEIVNLITQQETKKDEYKITQTMYLPPACSTLDIQPEVRASTEQVVIMQAEAWRNNKNIRKNEEHTFHRSRSNSSGYVRKEDDYNKDRQEGRRYSRGDRSPRNYGDKQYFYKNSSGEYRRGSSQNRGDQPRYEKRGGSGDRYKSYGNERNSRNESPYRGGSRRGASPYNGGRRDQDNNSYRSDRYRRESRSPGNRNGNYDRAHRQSPVSDNRMPVEYRKQDSRRSPARDSQTPQRRRSTSTDRREDHNQCRRCGDKGHKADKCEMFTYWRGKPCDCGLLHRRKDCNRRQGAFVTEIEDEDRREDGQNSVPQMYLN